MRFLHRIRPLGILVLLTMVLAGSALAQESFPGPAAVTGPLHQGGFPQANLALWRTETVLGVGDVGQWAAIALDPTTGQPGIVYRDVTNNALVYIWRVCSPSCTWNKEAIDAAGGRGASLAYDASGNPHVSYYAGGFKHAYRSGATWQTEMVYDAYSDLPHTSLALDSAGRPRFAASVTVEAALFYFYYDGTSWHSDPVEYGLTSEDGFPSLVLDASNHPYIGYRDNGDLVLAHDDGGGWQFDTSAEDNAYHTSMGMDGFGNLHIAYYDGDNDTLNYARFDGSIWTYETVDAVGDWSYFSGTCSLYVRPAGVVFVSYYDAVNGYLKHATRVGTTWEIDVVDSQGDVGAHNSLAVNDKNWPFIAYYDGTNRDLKLAYRAFGAFLPAVYRQYGPLAVRQ